MRKLQPNKLLYRTVLSGVGCHGSKRGNAGGVIGDLVPGEIKIRGVDGKTLTSSIKIIGNVKSGAGSLSKSVSLKL